MPHHAPPESGRGGIERATEERSLRARARARCSRRPISSHCRRPLPPARAKRRHPVHRVQRNVDLAGGKLPGPLPFLACGYLPRRRCFCHRARAFCCRPPRARSCQDRARPGCRCGGIGQLSQRNSTSVRSRSCLRSRASSTWPIASSMCDWQAARNFWPGSRRCAFICRHGCGSSMGTWITMNGIVKQEGPLAAVFGDPPHGLARDEVGNMPLVLDELAVAVPGLRKRTLLVAMIHRPTAARQRPIAEIPAELLWAFFRLRAEVPLAHQRRVIACGLQRAPQRDGVPRQGARVLRAVTPKRLA